MTCDFAVFPLVYSTQMVPNPQSADHLLAGHGEKKVFLCIDLKFVLF